MYQDKYESSHRSVRRCRQERRRRKLRRRAALLVSLVLVLTAAIGGTIAYILTQAGPVKNTFNPSQVASEVIEDFKDNIKSNVTIKNTGNTDAYIRATIVVNWMDADGNVSAEAPVKDVNYKLTLAEDTGWDTVTSDGYYYYTSSVKPGDSTGVLIRSCKPEATKDGHHLSIEILAESIQSTPTAAVVESWNVTVDSNGKISK